MFVKYPSIEQFKSIYKGICKHYGSLADKPTITFKGTVKIHGTNAGIGFWKDGITTQSRNRLLSIGSDNAGFAAFIETQDIGKLIPSHPYEAMMVYGEWCGEGIQKGVAVTGMQKQFVVFSVMGLVGDEVIHLSTDILNYEPFDRIHNINDFQTYSVDIDFNEPDIEKLNAIRDSVEANCPVGAKLNPGTDNTVGEGVVWTATHEGHLLQFKHKGGDHQRSGKVREIKVSKQFTPEQVEASKEFMKEALKEDRLLQGLEYLAEMQHPIDRKSTGHFLKWVMQDILKELKHEIAELDGLGVTWKQLAGQCSNTAKTFYFEKCNDTI